MCLSPKCSSSVCQSPALLGTVFFSCDLRPCSTSTHSWSSQGMEGTEKTEWRGCSSLCHRTIPWAPHQSQEVWPPGTSLHVTGGLSFADHSKLWGQRRLGSAVLLTVSGPHPHPPCCPHPSSTPASPPSHAGGRDPKATRTRSSWPGAPSAWSPAPRRSP